MPFRKIQLIQPPHLHGRPARANEIHPQPPIGLLILAAFLKSHMPEVCVEVFDGKAIDEEVLFDSLDADYIGISTWFSNYENSIALARKIKSRRPMTKIIIGGPYATTIGPRIVSNNSEVDFVIVGEGELPLLKLLQGVPPNLIPGLMYFDGNSVIGGDVGTDKWLKVDLNELPLFTLEDLKTPYEWISRPDSPAMDAFPLSGLRGCNKTRRCEYCSMLTPGYRAMSPDRYWAQVQLLRERYWIDYFFETGDTLSGKYLRAFASGDRPSDVSFRVYIYPGTVTENDIPYMKKMGVSTIFMGIENVLHFEGKLTRKFRQGYTMESVFSDVEMLHKVGINVIGGFALGLPDENERTLAENLKHIRRFMSLGYTKEITVGIALPLPGSSLFANCLKDKEIVNSYNSLTGHDLLTTDNIDNHLLSQLHVNRYTSVEYGRLCEIIISLEKEIGPGLAHWGTGNYNVQTNESATTLFNK